MTKRKRIRVTRKGYTRKAYTRKNGTRVKGSYVKPSTFYAKDVGAPGRTPPKKRWYKPGAKMYWSKEKPVSIRRYNALKAHRGSELATARALQALSNVSTDKATKREAKRDADYFSKLHAR